jgi:hypothetical protein
MGMFLVVVGLTNADYVNVGLGALITVFSAHTLYLLKTGK